MVRKILFWLHLTAGVVAGLVILLMSVTGVLLTYERQLNEWTTSHLRSVVPTDGTGRMPIDALVGVVARAHPDLTITGITVAARADAPVVILAEPAPLYVDAYSGRELGARRGEGLRAFLASTRSWHRWLAREGERRPAARAVTGWSNLLFLFIVASGMYLWIPRTLSWPQVRNVLLFKRQYGTSKARDFGWHNVIGIWTAIPLFIIVLGAVPISFPWANDLVYRVVGEAPPPRPRPLAPPATAGAGAADSAGRQAARGSRTPAAPAVEGLTLLLDRAMAEEPTWRTVSVRFPRRAEEPLAFSIDRGDGGQPQLRSTLTMSRAGEVIGRETFADQSTGRQVRSVLRFAHTGEVLGLAGQTVAGVVTAGAVVMVWTGLALSWRRFRAWQARKAVSASGASLPSPVGSERYI